jgi:hypothetical protein
LETKKENAELGLVVAQMARKVHKMELDSEAVRKRSEAMQQENIRLREQPEKPKIGCAFF